MQFRAGVGVPFLSLFLSFAAHIAFFRPCIVSEGYCSVLCSAAGAISRSYTVATTQFRSKAGRRIVVVCTMPCASGQNLYSCGGVLARINAGAVAWSCIVLQCGSA